MQISIRGADQALRALRVLEPETAKQVGKEVSEIGKDLSAAIRSSAPSSAPMSGWKATSGSRGARGGQGWPDWSQIQASHRRRGMTAIVDTRSSPSMIAVVYETAGIQGGRSSNGRRFIDNLERSGTLVKSGKYSGRLARRQIKESYPAILDDLRKATRKAVERVNELMP